MRGEDVRSLLSLGYLYLSVIIAILLVSLLYQRCGQ